MAAATDLFRERGFRETSLGDIGAAAGVSGPAIYRYFKSKGELLSVLIEEAAITWRETVDDVLNEDTPPLVTLERLIDAAIVLQLTQRQPARRVRQGVPLPRRRRAAAGGPHRAGAHGRMGAPALRGPARASPTRRRGRPCTMVDGMLRSITSLSGMDQEQLARVMKDMVFGGLLSVGVPRPVAVAGVMHRR